MPGLPSPPVLFLAAEALDPVRREALYGAAALLVAAAVLLVATAIATMPRRPHPAEPTMELGDEPPAVVDLLTDDFEVTAEAVPATLIDLAARRWLSLEQYGEDQTICRLRSQGHGALQPYEQRVLTHLGSVAANGVVPAEALTTGPEAASKAWWRAFGQEVVRDAQGRGLCQRRWPPVVAGLAWLGVLGAGGLLWASGVDSNEEGLGALAVAVVAGLVVVGFAAGRVSRSDRQRDTDAGLAAAGAWLGVRRYLADHGDFANQPAAAVEVWDRYLAHAAALDLAGLAVQQLPLGAEDDRHAWSAATGEWRPVTVDYPRFKPGWGRHPAAAILLGLIGLAASTAVIWTSYTFAHDTTMDGRLTFDAALLDRAGWIALLVCLAFLAPAAYAVVELGRGVADLFGESTDSGVVLRARAREGGLQTPRPVRYFTDPARRGTKEREPRYYVAVDTGAEIRFDAWRVRRRHYHAVRQHQRVTATFTPRLGYVRGFHDVPIDVEVVATAAGVTITAVEGDAELLAAAHALSLGELPSV